jgi:hypothetical protein
MSIQSLSFWQQDANYWNRSQQRDQSIANTDSLITTMGSITTNESAGLASIANQTALNRVNTALTAAIQNELQQTTSGNSTAGSSTPGSSTSSPSSSTTSASNTAPPPANAISATGAPASGTGTVPLSANTSLLTLGIPEGGSIVVSDGTNATTYKSTGTDTVANLLTALNANVFGNAQVNAYLNGSGDIVLSGTNTKDTISIAGLFAPNIGFAPGNQSFLPTPPSPASTSSSSSNSGTSGSSTSASSATSASGTSASSTSSTSNPITAGLFNSAGALQTGATAEFLLGSTGATGSVVNLLA